MNEFFLTKAEIDALLEQNRRLHSLFDQELTDILQGAVYLLEKHLSYFLSAGVSIDGFYVERTTGMMGTPIKSSDAVIFPVEFPLGETYVIIRRSDAQHLAAFLNTSLNRSLDLLVEEFTNAQSEFLTEQTGYWQQGRISHPIELRDFELKTPIAELSHFARYNINFNSSSLELFWLMPGERTRQKIRLQRSSSGAKRRVEGQKIMNVKKPKIVNIEPFEFDSLAVDQPEKGNNAIEIVNDVTIQITAELGSTQMRLEDIMKLKIGDVISLEKAAGDPADVYVSDLNIAKAEITVVDDHLGLRILAMDNLENRIKY